MALVGGLLTFTACSEDIEREPSPIVDPNCPGAYFLTDNNYAIELEPEAPLEMTLTIGRTNTESAENVKIEVLSNSENVFEVPETVTFEAGQAEAPLNIKFPNAEIGISYSYELKFAEGSYNPYANQQTYVSGSMIRIKWNPIETSIYTDGIVSAIYGVDYPLTWYITSEYAEFPDGSMRIRMLNPYQGATANPDANGIWNGYPYVDESMTVNNNVKVQIDINGSEATMQPSYFGVFLNEADGQLLGGSAYGMFQGTKDDYPLGEVTYNEDSKQPISIVFGPNSLFGSVEALFAEGKAGLASNPTTLFFSVDAWKEYMEENVTE